MSRTTADTGVGRYKEAGYGTRDIGGRCWDWRDGAFIFLIVAAAFGLRLIYLFQLRDNPYFDTPVMDMLYHHDWAKAFAEGERFWDEAYFRAPLYPWFLGVLYKLFGVGNFMAVRLVQIGLGSVSCGLLYIVGRLAFSRGAGLIAGLIAASYWIFIYFDCELLIPVLIIFLDLVLLLLLLWTGDRKSAWAWGACGLAMGVSAIARPNILLLAPALVVWIFVMHRPKWGRAFGYAFCLFLGTVAPILPITIRNYRASEEFALIATQGGVNFYIGNNPNSDGRTAIIPGDPGDWVSCYKAQIERAEKASGRSLKATEVSQWYFRMALRFWGQEPGKALRLTLKKLGYFWSDYEIWNNQDMYFVAEHHTPIARRAPIGFWLVGPLGALGTILCLGRAKRLFPIWGFVGIYTASVVMFFVCARYRAPVAFVMTLTAGCAICWLAGAVRDRRWGKLAGAACVLAVMGWAASRLPAGSDLLMLQQHRATGMRYATQEKYVEANEILTELARRAESVGAGLPEHVWFTLGKARVELEDYEGALGPLEEALAINPNYGEALTLQGYVLTLLGRPGEGIASLERLVEYDPDNGAARMNLARALLHLDRVEEATPHILRAIELEYVGPGALLDAAEKLIGEDRRGAAVGMLRAGVERIPDDVTLASALIEALAGSRSIGERVEAVRVGEAACERTGYADALVLKATAKAQQRAGRDKAAMETARKALDAARRGGLTDLAAEIELELKEYEEADRP